MEHLVFDSMCGVWLPWSLVPPVDPPVLHSPGNGVQDTFRNDRNML